MRLIRRWKPLGTDEEDIQSARFFAALLYSALFDSASGKTGDKGKPIRSRTFDASSTRAIIEDLRRHACRTHGAKGSARCEYWNSDEVLDPSEVCSRCQEPLVSWSSFKKNLQEGASKTESEEIASKGMSGRQVDAWRSGSSFDLTSAVRVARAAEASGIVGSVYRRDLREIIETVTTVIEDVQSVRRFVNRSRQIDTSGFSLWQRLKSSCEAICFTWHQPDDGFQVSYLPASTEPGRVVPRDVLWGMGGHHNPELVAPRDAQDVAAVLGKWAMDAPMVFSIVVSRFPLPIEQADLPCEEVSMTVRLVVRPQRLDGSEDDTFFGAS